MINEGMKKERLDGWIGGLVLEESKDGWVFKKGKKVI